MDLEEALHSQYIALENENTNYLTHMLLLKKAKGFGKKYNIPTSFTYSITQLLCFKKNYAFALSILHRESSNADPESIKVDCTILPPICSKFTLEDIYNLDKIGLIFRQLPKKTIRKGRQSGKKLVKDRLTINFIINTIGSNIRVQVIGKAKFSRSFGHNFQPYQDVDIYYYNNKTAWMKSDIFVKIIKWFNFYIT